MSNIYLVHGADAAGVPTAQTVAANTEADAWELSKTQLLPTGVRLLGELTHSNSSLVDLWAPGAHPENSYAAGQWWIKELEQLWAAPIGSGVTPDQKRAAKVALDLAQRSVQQAGWFSLGFGRDSVHLLEDGQQISVERLITLLNAKYQNPIQQLIQQHAELLDKYPYAYFELAYTRRTDWMAWITSHPSVDNPDREVLASGQGSSPEEACEQALHGTL